MWMRSRTELRHRLASSAVLALLIGLAGAVVLTALAGASRTDSAYRRYLDASHSADLLISNGVSGRNVFYRELARLPVVQAAGVTLALANVIAALPGRAAARTRPAVVLRTE